MSSSLDSRLLKFYNVLKLLEQSSKNKTKFSQQKGVKTLVAPKQNVDSTLTTAKTAAKNIEPTFQETTSLGRDLSVTPYTPEEIAASNKWHQDRFIANIEAMKRDDPNWYEKDLASYYTGKRDDAANALIASVQKDAATAKAAAESAAKAPAQYADWIKNIRSGYGPQGQGARSEKEVPGLYRDPKSGYGVGVELTSLGAKLVYYDHKGRPLRSSNFTAPELYRNADEFGIDLSGIGDLGKQLDTLGIGYKPGELQAGTGSNLGINFQDIAAGKLGSAYDWTKDPYAAQKGPYAASNLAASQTLADKLGIKKETSESLATLDPNTMRGYRPNVMTYGTPGNYTIAQYTTPEEAANAAKYYSGIASTINKPVSVNSLTSPIDSLFNKPPGGKAGGIVRPKGFAAGGLTTEQLNALKKFQSFQQQQALDQYLSGRATQYGTTPKGAKADTGWTAGETLANPFAGLTDFGKKTVQVSQGGGEEAPTEEEQAKTASDLFREKFGEQLGHKSTFTKAYKKDDKGNPVEVELDSLTPEQLNSGEYVLFMGGKTGGTERERMAQAYIPKGDKLIPVGDPSYYKGEHPDAQNVANALKIASIASLPFGGVGGLLGNVSGQLGSFLGGSALANVGANALVSGALQGGIGTLTGQSFGKGFRSGAGASLVGSGVDALGNMTGLNQSLGQFAAPVKSLATSGVTSLLTGRPFDLGQAAKGAAINYGLNQVGQNMGIDPKQQAALMKFYKFAAPMIAARRKPGG